jgi:cystathionine beta-lyase family protein involved in aluminum resistance
MPGYEDDVIMAAGTFIQGASLELTADGPIRPPYLLYVQGGLTYEHVKLAVTAAVKDTFFAE